MKIHFLIVSIFVGILQITNLPKVHAAFKDVPTNHSYYEAINWAQEKGIVQGYNDGTFKPDAWVNRAEFVKILLEAKEAPYQTHCDQGSFPDVYDYDWFSAYTSYAKCSGIIQGYPDGTFRAANPINMAEAAKIIAILDSEDPLVIPENDIWWGVYTRYIHNHDAFPPSAGSRQYSEPITRSEMVYMLYALQKPEADWDLYTNNEFFFSVKHPKEMTISIAGSERRQVVFENDSLWFYVKVRDWTDPFENYQNPLLGKKDSELTINNRKTLVFRSAGYCDAGSCGNPTIAYVIQGNGNRVYELVFNGTELTQIAENIVDSFKLLEWY